MKSEFFPVPNSLVDDAWDSLGTRGIGLYILLARQPTLKSYMGPDELATKLRVSPNKVKALLKTLYSLELINNSDLENVLGKEEVRSLEGELIELRKGE